MFLQPTPGGSEELTRSRLEIAGPLVQGWQDMSTTLMSLADGADLIFTGINFEDAAANVAEHYDIPLATLHYFPLRPNGQTLRFLPAPLARSAVTAFWWASWRGTKKAEDAQRRELGLPKATGSAPRRITERGSLEIQAYDEACFPGLAAEWTKWNARTPPQRPFVGTLTLDLQTDADEEVASWIAAGTPPIYFGFGSIPVESPADTIAMISAACSELGERALIGAAGSDFSSVPHPTRPRQGSGRGELCDRLSRVPGARPPRWLEYHAYRHARGGPATDPLLGHGSRGLRSRG